jgi:hypothetical protein
VDGGADPELGMDHDKAVEAIQLMVGVFSATWTVMDKAIRIKHGVPPLLFGFGG